MAKVQITEELFRALLHYHLLDNIEWEAEIKRDLGYKLDAMVKRQLYTQYKTAPAQLDREKARKEYLDRQGIPEAFRW